MKKSLSGLCALIIALGGLAAESKGSYQVLRKKLDNLMVEELEYDNASILQVVKHLREYSKKVDDTGKGINIILSLNDKQAKKYKVSMELDKIPLGETIRYVCMVAGLEYRVLNHAVLIGNKGSLAGFGDMVTRTYKFHPANLQKLKSKQK